MTATDDISGKILIHLDVIDGKVGSVEITDTRPQNVARVFSGRKMQDVAGLTGAMFSLCGRAQSIASLMAMENALDLHVTHEQTAARDVLRLAEMVTQTALRIGMSWPSMLDIETRPDIVQTSLAAEIALESKLFGQSNWKKIGGIEFDPDTKAAGLIIQDLKGAVENVVSELGDKLRIALKDQGLSEFGSIKNNEHIEEGALKRQWNNANVKEARKHSGVGLACRLEARIADFLSLPDQMAAHLEAVGPASASEAGTQITGQGQAFAETVRGTLCHDICICDGLIDTYEISAPTDTNFLSTGPVYEGLMGQKATAFLDSAAELHVLAIDPCVNFTVEIGHA